MEDMKVILDRRRVVTNEDVSLYLDKAVMVAPQIKGTFVIRFLANSFYKPADYTLGGRNVYRNR